MVASRISLVVMGIIGAGVFASFPARAVPPQQVAEAIRRGQEYLRGQEKNGSWEDTPGPNPNENFTEIKGAQWGGTSALATYALLASGDSPQAEHIKQAIRFIGNADLPGIYALGMRAQIWQYLPPSNDVRAAVQRDFKGLLGGMRSQGEALGLYFYTAKAGLPTDYDHSVSQYGILGMWAVAQRSATEVPDRFWSAADRAWRGHQDRSGGWCYINGRDGSDGQTSASMTAAGVATLFITQDYLHPDAACRGNLEDAAIEAGLKWMGDHFQDVLGDGKDAQHTTYYTLYGVERIGVAAGRKYLGSVNWFDAGADWLLKHQNPDGSWGGGNEELWGKNVRNISSTSFSLLFLSRGRAPVLINKLLYDVEQPNRKMAIGAWNQRPRDAANITRWVGKQLERDLNWQSVNLSAPVEELHDAPILYLAGNQALNFTAPEQAKLRQFVEEGGMILGNADCAAEPFAKSFRKLGTDLFKAYEFRELPADHPIYNIQFPRDKWRNKPSVLGLSNGARELMLLIPSADAARYWQTRTIGGKEEMHELAEDIVLYATDKQSFQHRGETYLVRRDDGIKADRSIKIARLEYPANWDPEPAGWRRLASVMHNRFKVDLEIAAVPLGEGKLGGYQIAHLTGTTTFQFSPASQEELRTFIKGGGTLIVDAAGGSPDFASAAESQLAELFPDTAAGPKSPLPADHPLFSAVGKPIDIIYRRTARKIVGGLRTSRLRALTIDNRPAVFLSAEDLSVGLVGQAIDGVMGYDPKTATELMADILLFAAKGSTPRK